MKHKNLLLAALLLSRAAFLHAADTDAAPACTPVGKITPICGLHSPEDLELLPDGQHLLVSEAGDAPAHGNGGLAVLDLNSKTAELLTITAEQKAGWGDADCTEPFVQRGTHGIHLSQRKDGIWQILAVNHAPREAIELFELQQKDGHYSAIWRGCVVNNTDGMHNDVAALPDGGFVATVMFSKDLMKQKNTFEEMTSGHYPGYLVEWHPDTGMKRLPKSDAPFNNGVSISKDGRYAYFNAWTGKQIDTYDRQTQQIIKTVDVPFFPDNLTKRVDGILLSTGIDDLNVFRSCMAAPQAFCQAAFTVFAFDPKTKQATPFFHGEPGLISGASVALQVKDKLYVGSYAGNRVLQIDVGK